MDTLPYYNRSDIAETLVIFLIHIQLTAHNPRVLRLVISDNKESINNSDDN